MLTRNLTLKEAFDKCNTEGHLIVLANIDVLKIKSTLKVANADINGANSLKEKAPKESYGWNTIYKLCYDALHELVEAFLRFDKIKSDNHQCLFADLCERHPELELSWEFFEKIRTKRNGIIYYGTLVSYKDWKEVELQMNLYINIFKKQIEEKLKE